DRGPVIVVEPRSDPGKEAAENERRKTEEARRRAEDSDRQRAAGLAQAERRFALLIGNQAYAPEIGALANPHNDVALLEKTLRSLGFEVATLRDADLAALTRAVNAYARRLAGGGQNAVGFFYYSGHGAADGGTNYLIPTDVKTPETGELWDQSLRLTEITRKLKNEAGNATHFVVFDA